jgi:predicted nuclease of restriction endonuclease-like (RecB) superfamily
MAPQKIKLNFTIMAKQSLTKDYKAFFTEIKEKIYQSQYEAMKQVNKALIKLYWDIGKSIVEKQQQHKWGKSVVENLAADLQKEFAGASGYSARNLWYMRTFYDQYKQNEKLQPMVAEISWSHNIMIMEKCKDDQEREFYILMSKKYGWTKNVLLHHIEGKSFEKFLLGQTNFDQSLPEKYKHQAKLAVSDEYNFEFLEIGEEHSERELELAIMKNMRKFLVEMGGDFSFIGNQYKLGLEEDFYIDILLYHRRLKALVAIELKTGKFKAEYAGKMNLYLAVLNDKVKMEDENPSIGIIVCKEKNRTTVEYALKEITNPIGVASYKVSASLPKDFKKYLPSSEAIAESLAGIFESLGNEGKAK